MKNTIILIGIALVGILGYYLYFQKDSIDLQNESIDNEVAVDTEVFLKRLYQLQTINLDNTFFSDPRYKALIDMSEPIQPTAVGRSNPFAVAN